MICCFRSVNDLHHQARISWIVYIFRIYDFAIFRRGQNRDPDEQVWNQ